MNIVTEDIDFGESILTLTNQRVIYWKSEQSLILSDVHIGKTAHFRQHGIAVSDAVLHKDLERLENLIAYFKPQKLIVVGDLFHANYNSNITEFKEWLTDYTGLEKILVKGNHDRIHSMVSEELNFSVTHKLKIQNITFKHDLDHADENEIIISGHIHPGVKFKTHGKQYIKLPCYYINETELILPAFSLFTGLNTNFDIEKGNIYAFDEEIIFKAK